MYVEELNVHLAEEKGMHRSEVTRETDGDISDLVPTNRT